MICEQHGARCYPQRGTEAEVARDQAVLDELLVGGKVLSLAAWRQSAGVAAAAQTSRRDESP